MLIAGSLAPQKKAAGKSWKPAKAEELQQVLRFPFRLNQLMKPTKAAAQTWTSERGRAPNHGGRVSFLEIIQIGATAQFGTSSWFVEVS